MRTVLILIKILYTILIDLNQKKFEIKRDIPKFDSSAEDIFSPYNFVSSDIIDGGTYVFDTASLYSWKNKPTTGNSDSDKEILISTKYNENIKGKIQISSNYLNWISINSDKYTQNFGSIAIPIKFPDNKKEEIESILGVNDGRIYNYLDLIKNEIREKYINYIQDSIQSGYILFGEKDEIFDKEKNDKDIKTCTSSIPMDNDDEFLNYWNCKITSFSADNMKLSSLYSKSMNGDIYAIFALSEEYIIAPNKTGGEIINYYRDLIGKKKCSMEQFTSNIKIMVCQKINYSGLPDFTINLEGEIPLIALSFDLFKNKNETHLYFKILLNELDTKEYWYLGDPIIKNYNFLFDYNNPEEAKITIVSSDKYESLSIIITCASASFIGFIFFSFLLLARIRINILSKAKKKNQNDTIRKEKKKIKKIIRNQNDFEIPEGNIPIPNLIKNSNIMNDEENDESKNEDEEDIIMSKNSSEISSSSGNSSKNLNNSSISRSFGNEKDLDSKIKKLKKRKNNNDINNNEYEMNDLSYLNNNTEEGECEMIGEDEGSLPPLNKGK